MTGFTLIDENASYNHSIYQDVAGNYLVYHKRRKKFWTYNHKPCVFKYLDRVYAKIMDRRT